MKCSEGNTPPEAGISNTSLRKDVRKAEAVPKPQGPQSRSANPPEGMLSYCTWAQDAISTKTQKENWLVSGLKDHRYLSVTRMRHRGPPPRCPPPHQCLGVRGSSTVGGAVRPDSRGLDPVVLVRETH